MSSTIRSARRVVLSHPRVEKYKAPCRAKSRDAKVVRHTRSCRSQAVESLAAPSCAEVDPRSCLPCVDPLPQDLPEAQQAMGSYKARHLDDLDDLDGVDPKDVRAILQELDRQLPKGRGFPLPKRHGPRARPRHSMDSAGVTAPTGLSAETRQWGLDLAQRIPEKPQRQLRRQILCMRQGGHYFCSDGHESLWTRYSCGECNCCVEARGQIVRGLLNKTPWPRRVALARVQGIDQSVDRTIRKAVKGAAYHRQCGLTTTVVVAHVSALGRLRILDPKARIVPAKVGIAVILETQLEKPRVLSQAVEQMDGEGIRVVLSTMGTHRQDFASNRLARQHMPWPTYVEVAKARREKREEYLLDTNPEGVAARDSGSCRHVVQRDGHRELCGKPLLHERIDFETLLVPFPEWKFHLIYNNVLDSP